MGHSNEIFDLHFFSSFEHSNLNSHFGKFLFEEIFVDETKVLSGLNSLLYILMQCTMYTVYIHKYRVFSLFHLLYPNFYSRENSFVGPGNSGFRAALHCTQVLQHCNCNLGNAGSWLEKNKDANFYIHTY